MVQTIQMILNMSGEVNQEMLNELIKSINNLTVGDCIHIYFTSTGGLTDVGITIVDIINKNHDKIGMTFYGEIFSAGMTIFLAVKCKKWLLLDTRGMYHFAWQDMSINEAGKPSNDYDSFSMKEMKSSKERTIKFLETTKLTDKEIACIKKGRDLYLSYDRMLEINT